MWRRLVLGKPTDILEERTASIFKVDELSSGLLFDPEDGGNTFPRNISEHIRLQSVTY
jgi:hypothetical protein